MSNYVVAIPTYNRPNELVEKTLETLLDGGIKKNAIYIFVANAAQRKMYEDIVPKNRYNKIIVGKLGIRNQRKFISQYFPPNQYIVSIDDDVEKLMTLRGEKLTQLRDVHAFFVDAHRLLKSEKLFIWGIYPVYNPYFMKKTITTDLRFIIGVMFGYINRHNNALYPSSDVKEDYEQSVLYHKMDGGVIRYNYVTPKTKFNAPGGLGTDRLAGNRIAANHLVKKYPDIFTKFYRKDGTPEVRMARLPREIR